MACNGMASSFFPSTGFLLQMQTPHDHHEDDPRHHLPPSLAPGLSHDYNGVAALLGKRSSMAAYEQHQAPPCEEMNGEDELSDDCGSQLGEKKRRLNMEQVRTLEKNFELGNKLEPERKMQLARALGLQPRQIAIWFQNRRARWKTKQLEKDYDLLKKQFEAVKSENDALQSQNKKLQAEILALNGREMSSEPINLNKETEVSCSYKSDNSSDINLEITRTPPSNESPSNNNNNNSHQQSMPFFPIRPPVGSTKQLPPQLLQCPKVEHGGGQEESFCNMFCSLDDHVPTGFWTPWQEQQSFH